MPYYDYKCKTCEHTWEEQHTIDSRNVPRYNPCPECGTSDNIILLMSAPSIGDPVALGVRRPNSAFRDRLRQIENNHSKPGGQRLKSRYAENITEI